MAFKRSAVRSRLSPPKSLEIVRFRDFFFLFSAIFQGVSGVLGTCPEHPIFAVLFHLQQHLQWCGTIIVQCVQSVFSSEGVGELLHRSQSNRILNVQIMLSHVHICMTHDALNGSKVNTQGLHLADIGMSTGVGAEVSYPFNCFQGLLVLRTEIRRITGFPLNASFPDIHKVCISEGNCTGSEARRNRNIAVRRIVYGKIHSL